MRQVGYLSEKYEDARSEKYKILKHMCYDVINICRFWR